MSMKLIVGDFFKCLTTALFFVLIYGASFSLLYWFLGLNQALSHFAAFCVVMTFCQWLNVQHSDSDSDSSSDALYLLVTSILAGVSLSISIVADFSGLSGWASLLIGCTCGVIGAVVYSGTFFRNPGA
ncbi:hypothetical protein BK659_10930 [Pseudomonas brassicacearum]|uniref:Uncharacterized protein n=1 Tax=Pseudomonas brassicacearum TaxID=930166 RepID=A0A423H8A4_9PSED|nr:hypothetical protein [Pseudomonas brassicacearum]RON09432.1 hypothetical protein BK659_10930 [Pseudomonas brassicacearum]